PSRERVRNNPRAHRLGGLALPGDQLQTLDHRHDRMHHHRPCPRIAVGAGHSRGSWTTETMTNASRPHATAPSAILARTTLSRWASAIRNSTEANNTVSRTYLSAFSRACVPMSKVSEASAFNRSASCWFGL